MSLIWREWQPGAALDGVDPDGTAHTLFGVVALRSGDLVGYNVAGYPVQAARRLHGTTCAGCGAGGGQWIVDAGGTRWLCEACKQSSDAKTIWERVQG